MIRIKIYSSKKKERKKRRRPSGNPKRSKQQNRVRRREREMVVGVLSDSPWSSFSLRYCSQHIPNPKFIAWLFHPQYPNSNAEWQQRTKTCHLGWDLRSTKPSRSATKTTSLAPSRTTPTPSFNTPAKPWPRAPKSYRIAL